MMGCLVKCFWSVFCHLFFGSSLCSVAKSNSENSIGIGRICSSWILIKLWRWIFNMYPCCVIGLSWRELFIWSICTFLSNCVGSGLHELMYSFIKILVSWIDLELLSVVNSGKRCVIINIWNSFDCGEMVLGGMIEDHLDVSMLT